MAAVGAADDTQITVRFKTKLPEQYKVPEDPVAVPGKLSRYGLSQVINGLLELETPRPFDFLVAGELVRQPLQQLVTALGISAELVLDVEYTTAVLPPKLGPDLPHDDWVSAVGSGRDTILSGSYDGVVRIWTGAGTSAGSFAAHKGRVTSAALLPGAANAQQQLALTAGQDGAARLWQLDASATESSSDAATLVAVYTGHADSVAALAAAPDGGQFATGGWDGAVHIWRTGAAVLKEAEAARADGTAAARASKRRKGDKAAADAAASGGAANNGAASGAAAIASAGAVSLPSQQLLAGHRQCVAALVWQEPGTLISGSWDHSVRLWDVPTGKNVDTLNQTKAVHAVATAPGGGGPIAFGGAEGALRLWDPRAPKGDDLAVKARMSHTDWIAAIAWHPRSACHLATASHDATVKLWDMRAAVPLHTISSHTDKVLSVAWVGPGHLASGGADSKLRLHGVQLPAS